MIKNKKLFARVIITQHRILFSVRYKKIKILIVIQNSIGTRSFFILYFMATSKKNINAALLYYHSNLNVFS